MKPVTFVVICSDISFRASGRVLFPVLYDRFAAKASKCPTTMTYTGNFRSFRRWSN